MDRPTAPDALSAALAAWLPQPGSDLYYAQLYAPPAHRRTLALIEGLRGEIARIPATCASPAVALPKLAWWREELAHLARGTPRHPLTQGFTAPDPALAPAAAALVTGVEAMLGQGAWPTRAARRQALAAAHGPLWKVALRLCADAEPVPPQAEILAIAVEEAALLRDARRFLDGGLPLVAQELVASAPADPAFPNTSASWHARVLGADLALLETELRAGLKALPQRRRLRPLATLAVLAIATVAEVRADGSRVWESRVELTPLRKLLLAWREARFAR